MENKKKLTTVLVSGNFNVLHPGHIRLLRFAKESGDHLIVAVESDRIAGGAAHVPEGLRIEGIKSNSWVNETILLDEPVGDLIKRLQPDVVIKGKEHQDKFNLEQVVLDSYGGKLRFSSGEIKFSSLDLLRKEFSQTIKDDIVLPFKYMKRHEISSGRIKSIIDDFSSLRVCVVGDLIIDEYITCEPLGMSQEDPTIVVTPVDTTRFIGGAGIVAAHAAGLGAKVEFITVVGNDSSHAFAENKLSEFVSSIDKIDKIGLDNVLKEVEHLTENNSISNLSEILSQEKNNIHHFDKLFQNILHAKKGIEELQTILEFICQSSSFKNEIRFDITLARGLNYYTSKLMSINMGITNDIKNITPPLKHVCKKYLEFLMTCVQRNAMF